MANDWTLTIDVGAGQVSTDYATWAALNTALSAYRTGAGSTLLYAKIRQNGSPTTLPISLLNLFNNCQNVTTIEFEDIDTSFVDNMDGIFNGCLSLANLDVTSLDVSEVSTFATAFFNCRSLLSLDISSWDTAKVSNMSNMFGNCQKIVTIYAGDNWSIDSVTNGSWMFGNCYDLKGAISYDSSKLNHLYANWTTGYLTYKAPPGPEPLRRRVSGAIRRMNSPSQLGRIN